MGSKAEVSVRDTGSGHFSEDPESLFIFIGAEIDSLGFVTKGMASTILNVGRTINRFRTTPSGTRMTWSYPISATYVECYRPPHHHSSR